MKKKHYQKPSIKSKKLKVNFFFSRSRVFDSLDSLIFTEVLAQQGCGSSCGGCFLPGMKVMMADGSYKAIEKVKTGDVALAYSIQDKKLLPNTVIETLVHRDMEGGYLVINKLLKVTGNHRMFVGREWVRADELKIGDKFTSADGSPIEVTSLEKIAGSYTVYNLHMEGKPHNYFIEGILVHNSGAK